ncbi:MAG TPA: response regulator transcription factor [Candidatus Acidoferrum sp.]|nr:response regulator transcription factor [Candidatus Acidoferrum sp.]
MLKDEKYIEICGEASNGLETILKAKRLGPDLIIMDMSMPGSSGFSAATKIRQARMHAKILFFTTHQAHEIERMARLAGFEGLVRKAEAARDLLRGVRAILQGNRFFGGQIISEEDKQTSKRNEQASKRRAPRSGAASA